ncbi:YjbQ family protein [Neobacillus niacini]|nr:YjbQ family protein [Neobacillus niacini]
MMYIRSLSIFTDQYNQYQVITGEIERIVTDSGIKNGVVTVQTKHTTTGVTVNESLECLESDIDDFLKRLVPEDHPYAHARMLKDYGSTAGNPTGHIKALITGNHCHFPIIDGEVVRGGAQEVYFCEFDGPSERMVLVYIQEG